MPNYKYVVALYVHRLAIKGGGAQRMICMLADALSARDFIVHLITWDDSQATPFYTLSSNVQLHRLGFNLGLADKMRRVRAVSQLLREHGVRVLVGFVMSGDRTILAAAKLARTRVIAAERNAPAIYTVRYNRIERWLSLASLHLAHRIVVQFPEFVTGYPTTLRDRIEIIPNPVLVPARGARPQQPGLGGRYTLLAVSRLDRVQKRLHKLIEAFALVAEAYPTWDLLIIGNGPEDAALQRIAVDRGIGSRVRIAESTHNICEAYVDSHLFAIPSRWEGFCNALAEALAHGLPAVGFGRAPGVDQLIIDGVTGWLADGVDDAKSLARALDEAMANGAERARRGKNGTKAMLLHPPEEQFDRWANLIRSTGAKL